jgi:hypothetical protein
MSTPSPALVAASPYLKQAIADVIQAITTITTGDPLQTGLRVGPAIAILANQLALLEPAVLAAEESVLGQSAIAQLNAVSAKLP